MPRIHSQVIESDEPAGPWGAKEVGEGSTNPTMGCFSNAIFDAMGVRVQSLPLSYEKVWRALKEKREREFRSP
jgi:4-hydroxybenzoyl-CoA reductase subunit alpha